MEARIRELIAFDKKALPECLIRSKFGPFQFLLYILIIYNEQQIGLFAEDAEILAKKCKVRRT